MFLHIFSYFFLICGIIIICLCATALFRSEKFMRELVVNQSERILKIRKQHRENAFWRLVLLVCGGMFLLTAAVLHFFTM
jgi:hypothetical protein